MDVEDGNTQTPAVEKIIGTQSLRDTLALMKRSKIFLKLEEKDYCDVFCSDVFLRPVGK